MCFYWSVSELLSRRFAAVRRSSLKPATTWDAAVFKRCVAASQRSESSPPQCPSSRQEAADLQPVTAGGSLHYWTVHYHTAESCSVDQITSSQTPSLFVRENDQECERSLVQRGELSCEPHRQNVPEDVKPALVHQVSKLPAAEGQSNTQYHRDCQPGVRPESLVALSS